MSSIWDVIALTLLLLVVLLVLDPVMTATTIGNAIHAFTEAVAGK